MDSRANSDGFFSPLLRGRSAFLFARALVSPGIIQSLAARGCGLGWAAKREPQAGLLPACCPARTHRAADHQRPLFLRLRADTSEQVFSGLCKALAHGGFNAFGVQAVQGQELGAVAVVDEAVGQAQVEDGAGDAHGLQRFGGGAARAACDAAFFKGDEGFVRSAGCG